MQALVQLFQTVPKPDKHLRYGTAGFRDEHPLLRRCMVAAGAVAALRSRHTGKCTGVMITASHNPAHDNGVKIVDSDGGMLATSWEPFAEALANTDDILGVIREACAKEGICDDDAADSVVFTGIDTRPHSAELHDYVVQGVQALGGRVVPLGEVTTPMLHFVVQQMNNYASPFMVTSSPDAEVQNYYWTIAEGYTSILKGVDGVRPWKVFVDCAHGVGALHVQKLIDDINEMAGRNMISISVLNPVAEGEVNDRCGAEWVQKGQVPPRGVDINDEKLVGELLCSLDGDADRIVFHTIVKDNSGVNHWLLLDGDRILALFATFIHKLLQEAGLASEISLGVVQTAYANGASTMFLRNQGMHVELAKTGVKHLHHKALNFDIGIYFEANGHGTAMFMPSFYNKIEGLAPPPPPVQRLLACAKCINQAVGDALSDLVFVLAALQYLKWETSDWVSMYDDLPSKQIKVPVVDRTAIVCSEDETQALAPEGMQEALNEAMRAVEDGRCFVRPSGTEDVVRVYAEARTAEDAARLAGSCVEILGTFIGLRA